MAVDNDDAQVQAGMDMFFIILLAVIVLTFVTLIFAATAILVYLQKLFK